MDVNAVQLVYKSVVLSKLTYAVIAWLRYTTAAEKQRLEACVRRAVRAGLCPADGPNVQQLVTDGDDALIGRILTNEHHVLRELLPDTTNHQLVLRKRTHSEH